MQNVNKGFCFYTLFTLLFFNLYCKDVCFCFHLPCSVVFFYSFLNTKRKIKIVYQFFLTVKSISRGANQYQIQMVGKCQVGDLPSRWGRFQPWRKPWFFSSDSANLIRVKLAIRLTRAFFFWNLCIFVLKMIPKCMKL